MDNIHFHLENINQAKFTAREVDIMACITAADLLNKQIEFALSISVKAIEWNIGNILKKIKGKKREDIAFFVKNSDKYSLLIDFYTCFIEREYRFKSFLAKLEPRITPYQHVLQIFHHKTPQHNAVASHLMQYGKIIGIHDIVSSTKEEWKKDDILTSATLVVFIESPIKMDSDLYTEMSIFKKENKQIWIVVDENSTCSTHNIYDHHIKKTKLDACIIFLNMIPIMDKTINISETIDQFHQKEMQHHGEPPCHVEEPVECLNETKYSADLHPVKPLVTLGVTALALLITASCYIFYQGTNYIRINYYAKNKTHYLRSLPQLDFFLLRRPLLIRQLEEKLQKNGGNAHKNNIPTVLSVAIVGMGGVGKTTLACYYARSHPATVIWVINAERTETIVESFKELASELAQNKEQQVELEKIKTTPNREERERKIIQFVKKNIKHHEWLLIFDNVDNILNCKSYLPQDPVMWGDGRVIITTRDSNIKNVNFIPSHNIIDVGELSDEEAITLFSQTLYGCDANQLPLDKREDVSNFLQNIPNFPLDVSLAAHYIKDTNTPYDQYIKMMDECHNNFNEAQEKLLREIGSYSKPRYNIVTLSINKLIELNPIYRELMFFIGSLFSQNIPKDLLKTGWNPLVVDNFIHDLKRYSLITSESFMRGETIPTFSLHRNTQSIMFNYVGQGLGVASQKPVLQSVVKALETYAFHAIDNEDYTHINFFTSHYDTILTNKIYDPYTDLLIGISGIMHYYLGDYYNACSLLEESLEKIKKHPNQNFDQIIDITRYLGLVYMEIGDYEKAQRVFEYGLSVCKQYCPVDNVKPLKIVPRLANTYRWQGRFQQAQELCQQNIKDFETYAPKDHVGLAASLTTLGAVEMELGNYEKALHYLNRSLAICQKNFPSDHMETFWVIAYIGDIKMIQGLYEEAAALYDKSMQGHKKNLSPNHRKYGCALERIGNILRRVGEYDKAQVLLEQSLDIYEKNFHAEHPRIAYACLKLSYIYAEMGNKSKARMFAERCHNIYIKIYGVNNLKTARSFNQLGYIDMIDGNYEEAENHFNKAMSIYVSHKHPSEYQVLEHLADLCLRKASLFRSQNIQQAKLLWKQSIDFLKRALDIAESHFPPESEHIARIRSCLQQFDYSPPFQHHA